VYQATARGVRKTFPGSLALARAAWVPHEPASLPGSRSQRSRLGGVRRCGALRASRGPDVIPPRLGSLLAILHAVGAVDFHFQNLVAAGDQARGRRPRNRLFHPILPLAASAPAEERLAARALGESVLRVGLLPFQVGEAPDGGRPDWERRRVGRRTARPRRGHRVGGGRHGRRCSPPGSRSPRKQGTTARPSRARKPTSPDFIEPLVEGFEKAARWIAGHRDELAAPDGPLASSLGIACASCSVRHGPMASSSRTAGIPIFCAMLSTASVSSTGSG
jgi:hypothetical protein